MSETTVTQDAGTVAQTSTETVQTEVKETPKPTFAETERAFREKFDKDNGRDLTKLFPTKAKEEPAKVETKVEPVAETKVETKVETPAETTKPKTGAARLKFKLALARQESASAKAENESLKARISAIEATFNAPKAETVAAKEPERKDFADDAGWLTALRKYDKDQREVEIKAEREQKLQDDIAIQATRIHNEWVSKLDKTRKAHADWDEVTAKVTVQFNPILEGCLMTADPEFLYYSATHQREVKNLNDMNEQSVAAAGTSDNIDGVLRYLAQNPTEIDKLNILSAEKAAKFIGRIEANIEAGEKPATIDTKRTSTGADDKATKPVAAATEDVKPKTEPEKTPTRVRPEPPAKISGDKIPSSSSWTDPVSMSIAERERHFREDPRFARKH